MASPGGEPFPAPFWQQTVDNLVTVGALFGDDEALMRAKAECTYNILRQTDDAEDARQSLLRIPAIPAIYHLCTSLLLAKPKRWP